MQRILVVEDDFDIQELLQNFLQEAGYEVAVANDGVEALSLFAGERYDLIVLDIMLPKIDGYGVCELIRKQSDVPIIMLTALSGEEDQIKGLDLQVDDYITKPFGTSELLARVRTALRHAASREESTEMVYTGVFTAEELTVDYDKRRVFLRGEDAKLTQNEYKIVALLSKYAGKVLTYDHIIKAIWGPNIGGDNQILRVNMANIRRKIEKNPAEPKYIFTEMGVGYRMIESD